jgi:hypothetical protein
MHASVLIRRALRVLRECNGLRAPCVNRTAPFPAKFVLSRFRMEKITIRFSARERDKSDCPFRNYNGHGGTGFFVFRRKTRQLRSCFGFAVGLIFFFFLKLKYAVRQYIILIIINLVKKNKLILCKLFAS